MRRSLVSSAIIFFGLNVNASDLESVVRKLARHYYYEMQVDERLKMYEREYMPGMVKEYVYPAAPVLRVLVEQRIVFRWTF